MVRAILGQGNFPKVAKMGSITGTQNRIIIMEHGLCSKRQFFYIKFSFHNSNFPVSSPLI